MAARLQAVATPERPTFLLYDTRSGHAGGRPRRKTIEDQAKMIAFVSWQLGVEESGKSSAD